jgi:hypothetical protein
LVRKRLGWQRWLLTKKERDERKEEDSYKKVQNSLQNFPMQSHGAEMLRLALVYATEKRLGVCAPLHDAIFAVAPADQEEQAAAALRECMERAAKDIIGVAIPIEMFVTRYPERFVPDDKPMAVTVWDKMMKSLEEAEERMLRRAFQSSHFTLLGGSFRTGRTVKSSSAMAMCWKSFVVMAAGIFLIGICCFLRSPFYLPTWG